MMSSEPDRLRVLLVDDDDLVRNALARLIRSRVEITPLPGVDAALALLEQQRFDLLISDLHMPDRDGLELLDEAERHWPTVYRVLCSGNPDPRVEAALARGCIEAFLPKPFDPATLKRILDEAEVRKTLRAPAL